MRSIGPYSNKYDAFTVEPGGRIREILPDNEREFSLKEIQYYIGSENVAQSHTSDGRLIFHAAEADNLKTNVAATLLCMHGDRDTIKGKALVCRLSLVATVSSKI